MGKPVAMELIKTLKTAVKTTIDTAGVDAAIEVCNVKAIPLTHGVESRQQRELDIKRTSFKYRNPENTPNEYEMIALNHYEALINQGEELPPFYTQKIVNEGDTMYYYYKPMKVAALCVVCHGDKEIIPKDVASRLDELYPDDKATGYKEGDFRGLIRVKFTSL